MQWSSDIKRSELNMWVLTYCYLLEEKYQGALHFAIMKYPFRINYAATDCVFINKRMLQRSIHPSFSLAYFNG